MFLPVHLLLAAASPLATASATASPLERAVFAGAAAFNISFVGAATFVADGGATKTTGGFGGWDDRAAGTRLSARSLVPGGSAIKPFTCVGAMGLAEQGRLDLDKPAHEYVGTHE